MFQKYQTVTQSVWQRNISSLQKSAYWETRQTLRECDKSPWGEMLVHWILAMLNATIIPVSVGTLWGLSHLNLWSLFIWPWRKEKYEQVPERLYSQDYHASAGYQKFKARGRYASHGDWFGFFYCVVLSHWKDLNNNCKYESQCKLNFLWREAVLCSVILYG